MICLHCKRDDDQPNDRWVPVAYLGKQQGWAHQSCERALKEQQRSHDAAIASAERKRARDAVAKRKMRIKYFARIASIGSVFLFALWLGGSAIAGVAKEAVLLLEQYWQ